MKPPQLVDKHGVPLKRDVLKKDVAGPTLSGVRSVIPGYPGDGLDPVRLANILRQADQGNPLKYFELAETIEERWPHYTAVLGVRKRSVAQLDIVVKAASDSDEHEAQAAMVRDWIDRDELSDEIFDILDAIGKGISMTEIIWDTSSGQWQPGRLEWRDPRWFDFDRIDGRTPMLISENGQSEALPAFKFIQAVIKAKSGLPVRSGVARIAVWMWMFAAYTLRDWAIFVQTFGQPIRVGKYDVNASREDKDTLYTAVANIAGDCAAIIPESMNIEFIDLPSTTGHSALYRERAEWLDQQISKLVLGQTTTTDAISGGHAVSKEHRQVQEDIERADAKAVSAVLNRYLVRPWVQLQSGPQDKYPTVRVGRPDEVDVKLVVDSVVKLVPLGLRVANSEMNGLLGLPVPENKDDVLEAQTSAEPPTNEPETPETANQALIALAARQGKDADQSNAADDLLDTIKDILKMSNDLEGFKQELVKRQPDLPTDKLAAALQVALELAFLTGRMEIADAGN